jgi:Sensors of blue-light using FAD
MIHIIYASVETQDFSSAQLTELLQKARVKNEDLHVTGMLLYSDGNFFQVLEGEPDSVEGMYKKLQLDKRHQQLTMIVREPIAKRYFADWSMGFSSVTPEELRQVDGLNDFFRDGSCFVGLDSGRAKKLLAAFAEGRWRAKLTGAKRP